MKLNKHILEAVNRGIKFALDDFEDNEQIQGQTNSKVNHEHGTKEWLDLMDEVVDLGLPSGTLWCKYNLGAKKETDCGNYYAWGEIKSKDYTKYNWENYKFGSTIGGYHQLTKYCSDSDYGLTELLPEDDAAYQNKKLHNFKFHIPTKEQCEELINYTIKEHKEHKGWIFTSKINGNKLFIPVCGCIENLGGIDKKDILCFLWSANLSDDMTAYFMNLYGNFIVMRNANRTVGMQIRPVINL